MKLAAPLRTIAEADVVGDCAEETQLLREMLSEACDFVAQAPWCESVVEMRFADGIGKIVLIAAAHIVPSSEVADDWLWVVIGDLPKAFVSMQHNPTAREAFAGYLQSMQEWADAIYQNRPIDHPYIRMLPTRSHADQLMKRVVFLREQLLTYMD